MYVEARDMQAGDVFRRDARRATWRVVEEPVEHDRGVGFVRLAAVYVSRPNMTPVEHVLPREGLLHVDRT